MRPAETGTAPAPPTLPTRPRGAWRQRSSLLYPEGPTPSTDALQCPLPSCLVEKVQNHFAQEQKPIAPGGLEVLVIRRLKRPIDEHWPANNVLLGNKSPIAAVETDAPMIAHREIMIRRHDNVVPLDVLRHIDRPIGPHIGIIAGRHGR